MYKNLLMILVAVVFLMSCGEQNTTSQDEQTTTQEEEVVVVSPTVVTLAEFSEKAEALLNQEIILEGNVIHVCKHGGKKMFITADDPDVRIKIITGEETAAFEPELEGSYIKVLGIVTNVEDETAGQGELHEEGEHEDGEHEEDEDHKNIYHKPQYSVVCVEYSVIEISPEEE